MYIMKLKDKTERIYEVNFNDGTIWLDYDIFNDTLDGIIHSLTEIKQELSQYHAFRFELDSGYENIEFKCWGTRIETEEEARKRLDNAKKERERKKKKKVKDLENKKKELKKLEKEIAKLEK